MNLQQQISELTVGAPNSKGDGVGRTEGLPVTGFLEGELEGPGVGSIAVGLGVGLLVTGLSVTLVGDIVGLSPLTGGFFTKITTQ